MRYLSFFLLLLSISLSSFSQQFDWASTGGNTVSTITSSGADDIAVDFLGNSYTIYASNEAQQCQGIIAPLASTGNNAFLHKFNAQGELIYIKVLGGDVTPLNLEVDESGNVYLLFKPAGASVVYNGVTNAVTASRNHIMKIDASGELIWLHNTGFNQTSAAGMMQYSNGFIFYQSGNTSLGKLDLNGNVMSSLSPSFYSSTISFQIRFRGSAVFPNGDLLFVASSFGDISYGGETLVGENLSFQNNPNLYLRTDPSFNVVFASYIQGLREPVENRIPVCIDAQGDIFSALQVSTTAQIGSDIVTGDFTNYANVIAKIDGSGNGVWARQSTTPISTRIWAMTESTDNSGVLFAGSYGFNAQFGAHIISASNSTSFVAKLDTDGEFLYASAIIGNVGSRPKTMTNDGNNQYYIGGKLADGASPLFSCIPRTENEGFFLGRFLDLSPTSSDCSGSIPGCTDPIACNFSAAATIDNGSCTFPRYFIPASLNGGPVILACDNPGGNYELAGNQACIAQITVNDPFCINTNWDQLCFDAYEECALGCTDNTACNFDPGALTDDGSCSFPGCNNPAACNFDPSVLCNDGSCIVPPDPIIDVFAPQQIGCTGDFVLSIAGSNFCGLVEVLIDGQSCTITSSSDSFINCSTVAGTGTVSLEVITIHGSTSTSISYLSPAIQALSISSSPCEGGLLMQIAGTNLCEATEVLFGDLSAPVNASTATVVEVLVPAGFGSLDVRVVSSSGTSNPLPFSYQSPVITGISIIQFSCTGGEVVQVLGQSFCDPIAVLINGEEQVVTASSPTSVEFITPPAIGGGIARLKVVSNGSTSNQLIINYIEYGCTNPIAVNFDPLAVCDNGFCVIVENNDDCPADINLDGQVNTGDLNALLSVYGSICP